MLISSSIQSSIYLYTPIYKNKQQKTTERGILVLWLYTSFYCFPRTYGGFPLPSWENAALSKFSKNSKKEQIDEIHSY